MTRVGGRGLGALRRRIAQVAPVCLAALAASAGPAGGASVTGEQGFGFTKAAKLEAEVDPEGVVTACRQVEYLSQASYEAGGWTGASTVPCTSQSVGAGTSPVHVGAEIPSGLDIDGRYEYRFVAEAGGGTVYGAPESFTTFGIEAFTFGDLNRRGAAETRAGAHPFEYRVAFTLNHNSAGTPRGPTGVADATMKDLLTQLPPGLIGNPAATPLCPRALEEELRCPADTQIGTIAVELTSEVPKNEEDVVVPSPLFNLVPPKGVIARFGAEVNASTNAFIDVRLRAGRDYGVTAGSVDTSGFADAGRIVLKLWGVPAAPIHQAERWCSVKMGSEYEHKVGCATNGALKPFLRNPTACTGPLSAISTMDSYQAPEEVVSARTSLPALTACASMPFNPSVAVRSSTALADSPTGVKVDVHLPQSETCTEEEGGEVTCDTAQSDLKDATVTFPAGVSINPSSADGLTACPEGEGGIGFTGFAELNPQSEPGVKTAQFSEAPPNCPESSKIGTVTIHTPLVEHPLPGGLYLAEQGVNPFGSMVAVYLAVYDPVTGIVVKLPGKVVLDETTGRITTSFKQDPQLPFEDLEVQLFGANEAADRSRAVLSTPELCGSYVTTTSLKPWDGNPASTPSTGGRPIEVSSGPDGGPCPATEAQAPNAPGFEAGTSAPLAGAYSPFLVKLKREDGSQRFGALSVTLPPGMTGKVAGVQECPQDDIEAAQRLTAEGDGEAERAHPSCPAGSEVGVVKVGVGSGAPYYVTGKAYFAGPYKGAPFSLVIDTPAVAGPFDLGNVVVRAGIYVNPQTAQVSVRSDPFPSIIDGIPLDIRSLDVEVTRREFTLNPTSCSVMGVSGEETSTAGQTARLADRFQVGGCGTMPFHPEFFASTRAHHTRKAGAALTVKLNMGAGQANVAKVHVQLPKKMPSELKTLKLACTEAQFAENPAGCPKESMVGSAVAHTPILPVPLQGPAIFVSHGGAGFPNLDLVLQGDGVTIDLVGDTFINEKSGITTSTFATVPDVPVSQFELMLPEQEYSALGGNGSFCKKPLYMPTSITGQNGVLVTQRTKIAVNGCRPVMRVLGHRVHGKRAKVRVRVPSAGRLVIRGKGVVTAVRSVKHARAVTIVVRLTRRDAAAAAKHHHRVRVKLKLRFKPKHGKALHAHTRLLLR